LRIGVVNADPANTDHDMRGCDSQTQRNITEGSLDEVPIELAEELGRAIETLVLPVAAHAPDN
jgi:hypothetical protein